MATPADRSRDTSEDSNQTLKGLRDECLNNEQFLNLLTNNIADVAAQKVERLNAITRNRNAVFLTVGGALFVAALTGVVTFAFSSLKQVIQSEAVALARIEAQEAAGTAAEQQLHVLVPTVVREQVDLQVEEARSTWNSLNAAFHLDTLLQAAEEKEGFSEDEARQSIQLLTQMAEDTQFNQSPQALRLLQRSIENFQSADRDDLVQLLEPLYSDQMLDKWEITARMTESIGRKLITFPVLPVEVGRGKMYEEWVTLLDRYYRYADATRRHRYPEVPYVYDLIIACMEKEADAVLEALTARARSFTESELNFAVTVATSLLAESWQLQPNEETALAKDRLTECIERVRGFDDKGIFSRATTQSNDI